MVMSQKKSPPKPKPVINYPPVATKKWTPPDKRPKTKPEPAYRKPPGISQKLDHSSLGKIWHKFTIYGDMALLIGPYSQTHKRFKPKSNGFQGTSNCVVACAFARIYSMTKISKNTLGKLLELGDELYLRSIKNLTNRHRTWISVSEVYKQFFIENLQITMTTLERITIDHNMLVKSLTQLFTKYMSAVLIVQKKTFSIWLRSRSYFLFDPSENNNIGQKWKGQRTMGFCYLAKFNKIEKLCMKILEQFDKKIDTKIYIYPCFILRLVEMKLKAPTQLPSILPLTSTPLSQSQDEMIGDGSFEMKKKKKPVIPDGEVSPIKKIFDDGKDKLRITEDEIVKKVKEKVDEEKEREKVEKETKKPPPKTLTHFTGQLPSNKIQPQLEKNTHGILHGTINLQLTNNTSNEQQILANSLSALIMLRLYRSKLWIPNTIDKILQNGQQIYEKNFKPSMELNDIPKCVNYETKTYELDINQWELFGDLESSDGNVLDLPAGLVAYFQLYDSCILNGPEIVTCWTEDDVYYMFNPNGCDPNGLRNREMDVPSTACVAWFKNLEDLVKLYLMNLKRPFRSGFYLSKVIVKDFVQLPQNWSQFQAIAPNKWILRAEFSQNDSMFPIESRGIQCTANATIAIVYSHLVELSEWSSESINDILILGNEFYRSCVQVLKDNNKFLDGLLMVDEVIRKFPLKNKEINLEIADCLINGLVTNLNQTLTPDLQKGCEDFFANNNHGVLTSHHISVAIWKQDGYYYYFDSHARNNKGIIAHIGTACCIRTRTIQDLVKAILANLPPDSRQIYNISRMVVKIFDINADGTIVPDLQNYTQINDELTFILRSVNHLKHPKYDVTTRGKQLIPTLVVAIGMNEIVPAMDWTKNTVDIILDVGDELYIQSVIDNQKSAPVLAPSGVTSEGRGGDQNDSGSDVINTSNVRKEFHIGQNQISYKFEVLIEGTIEKDLILAINQIRAPVIFESLQTVVIWRDDNFYYLFDPLPRDEKGEVYGKDDWSAIVNFEEVEFESENDEEEYQEEDTEDLVDNLNLGGAGDAVETREGSVSLGEAKTEDEFQDWNNLTANDEEGNNTPKPEMKGSGYWYRQEEIYGGACVLLFLQIDDLINYLKANTPPTKRTEISFKLTQINYTNSLPMDIGVLTEDDKKSGDWLNFKRVSAGHWILRGARELNDELYPEVNRGKQSIPMCLVAITFLQLYDITKFDRQTIDTIMSYGDRLYTFTIRRIRELVKGNFNGTFTEMDMQKQLDRFTIGLNDYERNFCIDDNLMHITIEEKMVCGDLNTKYDPSKPTMHSLRGGLEYFFLDEGFVSCILSAKDVNVAIFTDGDSYFMFDSCGRGPTGSGTHNPNGVACMSRFNDLELLIEVFLKCLSPEFLGSNEFLIHKVLFAINPCPLREHLTDKETNQGSKQPIIFAYKSLVPGKYILRSEFPTWQDPDINLKQSPIALIALTMSLIKKPTTWTKLDLAEIMTLGLELYRDTIDSLGSDYDPYSDYLNVERVQKDYMIGKVKANFEVRSTNQKGLIGHKIRELIDAEQNLRQGIEKFFEENSHGVLIADNLTLAIWMEVEDEEKEGSEEMLIYVFDPNPRGSTGLTLKLDGTACLMKFANSKLISEHLLRLVDNKRCQFVILPIEIVVEGDKKLEEEEKKRKKKCRERVKKKKGKGLVKTETTKALNTARTKIAALNATKTKTSALNTTTTKLSPAGEKKIVNKILMEERERKSKKQLINFGRHAFAELTSTESILRGLRSQFSVHFASNIRGKQALPNCLVCFVFHKILKITTWKYFHIDDILTIGNQLYIDSYNTYQPKKPISSESSDKSELETNDELSLRHVLRKFFIKDTPIEIVIYKPIRMKSFTTKTLMPTFDRLFQMENCCILNYLNNWLFLISDKKYYYLFDSWSCNIYGERITDSKVLAGDDGDETTGSAVVLRFMDLEKLVKHLLKNLCPTFDQLLGDEDSSFKIVLLGLTSVGQAKLAQPI